MLKNETAIVCPRGKSGQEPILIDIRSIVAIENRIHEVAIVTSQKAPELLAAFNKGYLDLHQNIVMLERERLLAEREQNRIKAVILLDKCPEILKQKGLARTSNPAGSEDLRNAVLDSDEEYQDAVDRTQQIACVIELLKGKLKSFEMAYTSVKKILGEGNLSMLNNPNLRGDSGIGEAGTTMAGFGKPRY